MIQFNNRIWQVIAFHTGVAARGVRYFDTGPVTQIANSNSSSPEMDQAIMTAVKAQASGERKTTFSAVVGRHGWSISTIIIAAVLLAFDLPFLHAALVAVAVVEILQFLSLLLLVSFENPGVSFLRCLSFCFLYSIVGFPVRIIGYTVALLVLLAGREFANSSNVSLSDILSSNLDQDQWADLWQFVLRVIGMFVILTILTVFARFLGFNFGVNVETPSSAEVRHSRSQ